MYLKILVYFQLLPDELFSARIFKRNYGELTRCIFVMSLKGLAAACARGMIR